MADDITTKSPTGYRLPLGARIVHSPEIELASVQRPGLLVPEILFRADGPDALEQRERWAREHYPAEPVKDCATCEHKADNPDGGHCYMFETEPKSDVCGQYKPVSP